MTDVWLIVSWYQILLKVKCYIKSGGRIVFLGYLAAMVRAQHLTYKKRLKINYDASRYRSLPVQKNTDNWRKRLLYETFSPIWHSGLKGISSIWLKSMFPGQRNGKKLLFLFEKVQPWWYRWLKILATRPSIGVDLNKYEVVEFYRNAGKKPMSSLIHWCAQTLNSNRIMLLFTVLSWLQPGLLTRTFW